MKVTTFVAVNGASSLHKAVNSTLILHGSDILIGQQLVQHLLSHEGSLSGLNLTHSQDKDYIWVSNILNFYLFFFLFINVTLTIMLFSEFNHGI